MLNAKTFSKFAMINGHNFIKKDDIWSKKRVPKILNVFEKMTGLQLSFQLFLAFLLDQGYVSLVKANGKIPLYMHLLKEGCTKSENISTFSFTIKIFHFFKIASLLTVLKSNE